MPGAPTARRCRCPRGTRTRSPRPTGTRTPLWPVPHTRAAAEPRFSPAGASTCPWAPRDFSPHRGRRGARAGPPRRGFSVRIARPRRLEDPEHEIYIERERERDRERSVRVELGAMASERAAHLCRRRKTWTHCGSCRRPPPAGLPDSTTSCLGILFCTAMRVCVRGCSEPRGARRRTRPWPTCAAPRSPRRHLRHHHPPPWHPSRRPRPSVKCWLPSLGVLTHPTQNQKKTTFPAGNVAPRWVG